MATAAYAPRPSYRAAAPPPRYNIQPGIPARGNEEMGRNGQPLARPASASATWGQPIDPAEERASRERWRAEMIAAGEDPDRMDSAQVMPPNSGGSRPSGRPSYQPPNAPQTIGFNPNADPARMADNDRARAWEMGDRFNQEFGDEWRRRLGLEEGYRGQADDAYAQLLEQSGYSPEEVQQILRDPEMRQLLEQDYGSNFLNDPEQAGVYGDPNARRGGFDAGALERTAQQGDAWTRGAFNEGRDSSRWALDRGDERELTEEAKQGSYLRDAQSGMEGNVRERLGRTREDVTGALEGAEEGVEGTLSTADERLQGAIDPAKLGISDRQVQLMKEGAARTVGARYASAKDQLQLNANQAGLANPLSIAAARRRLEGDESVNAADAMSNAELAGVEAQRRGEQDIARMRMDAATTSGEMGLRGRTWLGGTKVGALGDLGRLETGTEAGLGESRLGTEQYLGSSGLRTAANSIGRRLGYEAGSQALGTGMESDMAARRQALGQYTSGANVDIARDIESADAERRRYISANRQATSQANQQNQFARGFDVNNALASRYVGVANQRLAGQQERRQYLAGQTGYQGGAAQQNAGNRLNAAGTTLNAGGQATSTAANLETGRASTNPWNKVIVNALNPASYSPIKIPGT